MKENVKKVLNKLIVSVTHTVTLSFGVFTIPDEDIEALKYEDDDYFNDPPENVEETLELPLEKAKEIADYFRQHGFEKTYTHYIDSFPDKGLGSCSDEYVTEGELIWEDLYSVIFSDSTVMGFRCINDRLNPPIRPNSVKYGSASGVLTAAYDIIDKLHTEELHDYLRERSLKQ